MLSDFDIIAEKITKFNIEFLPLIFSLIVIGWFVSFLRWNTQLKNIGVNIKFKSSFSVFISGHSLLFIPGSIGYFIMPQILKNKFNVARSKSTAVVISDMLYAAIGLVILTLIGGLFFEVSFYIGVISGSGLILLFLILRTQKTLSWFVKTFSKIKFISSRTKNLEDSFEVIKKSTSGKITIYCSLLSVLFWLIEACTAFFIMYAYGITSLDILQAIPVYTSSILLGYISLIPLGTGVVEGSLTIFLQNHGVELSVALTAPIIIRLFTRWVSICVGFFALKYNDGFKILKEFDSLLVNPENSNLRPLTDYTIEMGAKEKNVEKQRVDQSVLPYFNQTRFPKLWLLFQYLLGGTIDKRKIIAKHLFGHTKILEIGCSSGNVSTVFRNLKDVEFLGIDIDDVAIKYAEKRFSGCNNFNFRCCNLEDLISEKEKFDCILFASILHHVSDSEAGKMLQLSSRLLSENGIIIISEPLPAEKKHNWIVKLYSNLLEQGSNVRTQKEYEDIIENILNLKISKSEIETISPFVFNWPTHGYYVTFVLERA